MERESSKHTPRVDEEMKREVAPLTHGAPAESRADEAREHEAPADGQPNPDGVVTSAADAPARSLPHELVELRTDVARHLKGKIFPATREEILADAADNNAPDVVTALLQRLPPGDYDGFPAVWQALGGPVEGGRSH